MSSSTGSVAEIILLPVYRRAWVFSCKARQVAAASSDEGGDESFPGKMRAWMNRSSHRMSGSLARQWEKAQEAKEGTLMNYSYRLGQWALSMAHPDETFLQAVPQNAQKIDIVFPSSIDERIVRRRLRLLIRGRTEYHRIWAIVWGVLTIPQLPLIVSPLPNLPIYYSGYRTWAHYRAWRGAQSLQGIILNIDRKQLCRLRKQLLEMQKGGLCSDFPEGSWPSDLLSRSGRYEAYLDATPDAKGRRGLIAADCSDASKLGLVAAMHPSDELEEILKPADRWERPLSDDCITKAAVALNFPSRDVLAHVSRARARALKEEGKGSNGA